jgi:hypothetical protein
LVVRVEFIDENGGGPGVRLRKRHQKKLSRRKWANRELQNMAEITRADDG